MATKKMWIFFCLLCVSFGYFHHGGGFNQNAIIGEIREVVENHSTDISRWLPITGDVSYYKDGVFSNKSPSLLFFVAPVYAVFHEIATLLSEPLGFDLGAVAYQMVVTHFLTFLCSGLWGALIGVLFSKILPKIYPRLGENDTYLLSYLLVMGSFNFPYSASGMVVNFESFWVLMVLYQMIAAHSLRSPSRLTLLALSCGSMMLANPFTVFAMPAVYIYLWREIGFKDLKKLIVFSLTAAIPLVPFLIYNHINFDFFLSTNRNHLAPIWTDPNLFLGVFDKPHINRLYHVFGPGTRSILTTMPFLFLGIFWVFPRFRRESTLPQGVIPYIASIFLAFFILLLTFNGWHGGTCFGPRYFILVLPLIALMSVPVFFRYPRLYCLLCCWSVFVMGVAASRGIWLDFNDPHQVRTLLTKFTGDPAFQWPSFPGDWKAADILNIYDLGDLWGLPGHWSVAPLILLHLAVVPYLFGTRFEIKQSGKDKIRAPWALKIMSLAVFLLIISRLGFTSLAPFINDEAQIQLRISRILSGQPLPLVGLSGSQPIPYGPFPTWFYAFVRFLSDDFAAIMVSHTMTHVVGLLILWGLLKKLFNPWVALGAIFLTASSPYLFNYSRITWDNTFLFVLSTMIVLSTFKILMQSEREVRLSRWWVVLGATSGLALGTHLMVIPLIASSYGVILFYCLFLETPLKLKSLLRPLGSSLLTMFLILFPYLRKIFPTLTSMGPTQHWGGLSHAHEILAKLVGFTSLHGFSEYFFQGDVAEFTQTLRRPIRFLQDFDLGWFIKGTVLCLLFWPLYTFLRGGLTQFKKLPPLLVYATLTCCLVLFFYMYTGHFSHSHYYIYLAWIVPVCSGYLLTCNWKTPRLIFASVLVLVALTNLKFIESARKYIALHEGIRGLGWGATVENQRRLVAHLCAQIKASADQNADVSISQVAVLPQSLEFFAQQEPTCRGIVLNFTEQGSYQVRYAQNGPLTPRSRLEFYKKE